MTRDERDDGYLGAREAATRLGIKLETLYAYASRGRIRSVPAPHGRARRYAVADIETLVRRRTGSGDLDPDVLHLGRPVLESSITEISAAGPRYRGHAALDLAADGRGFETTAELLWTGERPAERPVWPVPDFGIPLAPLAALVPVGSPPLAVLACVLPALAVQDPGRFDTRPEAVFGRARRLLPRLAASLALCLDSTRLEAGLTASSVAAVLATALGLRPRGPLLELIDTTLVLVADHELNASTFATRIAASTGADPYACLSAGVGALSGPLHGTASEQIARLIAEAGRPEAAEATIHERMRRGEPIPGFGHFLYRSGDPRTQPLLDGAIALAPDSTAVRTLAALVDAAARADLPPPNADVGLAAVGAALGLPVGMAPGLFAIGRAAGWVAHMAEHQADGRLVRPRARYPTPA